MSEIVVLSVGGSLIAPDKLDVEFLRGFKELILKHVKKGKRFIIITGGGRTSRDYQEAAQALGKVSAEDLDWLGIHGTRLNAHLMRTIFKDRAHPRFMKDPNEKINFREKILIAAGWKPGFSTDYDATVLAKQFGVTRIINLSNIDYAYDKDPKKFPNAKKLERVTWKEFRKIVGDKWSPGLNAPFDPIASKECEKLNLTVTILNGNNMDNLDKAIDGKKHKGTTIQ